MIWTKYICCAITLLEFSSSLDDAKDSLMKKNNGVNVATVKTFGLISNDGVKIVDANIAASIWGLRSKPKPGNDYDDDDDYDYDDHDDDDDSDDDEVDNGNSNEKNKGKEKEDDQYGKGDKSNKGKNTIGKLKSTTKKNIKTKKIIESVNDLENERADTRSKELKVGKYAINNKEEDNYIDDDEDNDTKSLDDEEDDDDDDADDDSDAAAHDDIGDDNEDADTSRDQDLEQLDDDRKFNLKITKEFYDRLVYFSKTCALTGCISHGMMHSNKTLKDGGCPKHIKFCSDSKENPTNDETTVELVLSADTGELGSGYVIVDHVRKTVVLAFRGSTTVQDWFSDFQIYPTDYEPGSIDQYNKLVKNKIIPPCQDCKIHRGFYRFKESLGKVFLKRIELIFKEYPAYHFVVVGHSLGAAMASIAGIELKLRGYNPTVLTYATPLMFNSGMREWVDKLFKTDTIHNRSTKKGELIFDKGGYFRVIHNQDYIPMVPPFYEAAGLEIFIEKIDLPHKLSDLEYRGTRKSSFDSNKIPKNTIGRVDDWLHTYEHRAYFVLINGCHGF